MVGFYPICFTQPPLYFVLKLIHFRFIENEKNIAFPYVHYVEDWETILQAGIKVGGSIATNPHELAARLYRH